MSTAFDVSSYIISLAEQIGEPVTNMKLQKLLYYSYAWHLVEFNSSKLFGENIEAWQYGPVVPVVYRQYRSCGADNIKKSASGDTNNIDAKSKEIIDEVFNVYGSKSAIELMRLSHSEAPWRDTYQEGRKISISDDAIVTFFSSKKQTQN
jgi:uncharacterized phage-associated protein